MGRHAPSAPGAEGAAAPDRWRTWVERGILAALAASTIVGVLRWAGAGWRTSILVGGAVALVVLVAALVAATVPPPHEHLHVLERSQQTGQSAAVPRVDPPDPPRHGPSSPDPRTWPGGP